MTTLPAAAPRSATHAPDAYPARPAVVEPAAYRLARLAPTYAGEDFLNAIRTGELPAPPIAELVGFDIRGVRAGEVTVAFEPSERHYNPIGSVHGGIAATLVDTAMGCAVHTKLPEGTGYTTTDLQVRYLRPITARTGTVLATGVVVHLGRRTATAEARVIQESTGELLATATSSLLVLRP